MTIVDRMTPTEEFLDGAFNGGVRGDRYYVTAHHYPPHTHDTTLVWLGYYEGLPHLKLIVTDRDIPAGVELQLYTKIYKGEINIGFTTLDGEKVSITVFSRVREGDTITFEFDLPPEVS